MRFVSIGLLAVVVAAAACNRDTTALNASSEPVATALASRAPVATTGTAEAAALREVTIPAGTVLAVVLDTSVGSDTSRVEQPVQAHLARAVIVRGKAAIPEGSRVSGVVTDATRSAKIKGLAHVAVRFDTLVPRGSGERYRIATAPVGRTAPATKKKDALEIGAPAAGGALIGALIGGKKGALIGTAAGGGAGTAVVLSTRGQEIHLPKGASLRLRLSEPVTIKVQG